MSVNKVSSTGSLIPIANNTSNTLGNLADTQISSPQDGQILEYDGTKWVNGDNIKEFARYGGSKTFSQLTSSLLTEANVDKFFLVTDGGTIASADAGNWVLPSGSVIPPDAHIAVIEYSTGVYKFDDFGGYIDISGKADIGAVTSTLLSVPITGWTQDTTSQSGVTLYKKQIALTNVYKDVPDVSIGASTGLPSTAEQTAYDLLKYVTVDSAVPCLYLYASEIPTTAFYINVEGVV